MSFQYLTNVSLDRAREDYLAALKKAGFCSRVEEIPVGEACQRITAQAVYAHICAPHYQACAMDGVALEAAVTFGATETTPVVLSAEQYRFVDTGDPVPGRLQCGGHDRRCGDPAVRPDPAACTGSAMAEHTPDRRGHLRWGNDRILL